MEARTPLRAKAIPLGIGKDWIFQVGSTRERPETSAVYFRKVCLDQALEEMRRPPPPPQRLKKENHEVGYKPP